MIILFKRVFKYNLFLMYVGPIAILNAVPGNEPIANDENNIDATALS